MFNGPNVAELLNYVGYIFSMISLLSISELISRLSFNIRKVRGHKLMASGPREGSLLKTYDQA